MAAPGLPAFPNKLWTLVEDPSTNDLICWNYAGTSFHIYDSARFSKELLPLYFKHNNIASFIRQLNLYGFRKVVKIETGGLKVEKDDMEFSHPCFIRDNENLLENIKRKVSAATPETSGKGDGEPVLRQGEVSKVLNEVVIIKDKQTTMNSELETLKRENETIWGEVTSLRQEHKKQQQIVNKLLAMNSQLENLKRENETLWGEVATLRQKHQKQQQIVHKLIQFLVTMVGNGQGTCGMPNMKRRMPLMINDSLSQPKKARDIEDLATVGQVQSPPATPNTPDSLNNQVSGQSASGLQIQEITDNIHQASPATVSSPNAESRQNLGTTDENDLLSFIKTPGTQGSSDPLNLDSNSLSNSYNSSLISNLVDVVKEHLNDMVSDIHNDNASGSQIDNRVTVPSGSTVVTAPSGELGTAGGGTNNSVALTSTQPLFCRSPSQPEVVENIENLQTDIDSLRDRLSAGSYTLDAATLMELINAETPVPPVPDSMKEDTFHFSQLLNSIDNDDSTIPVATENIRQPTKIEQSDLNPRGSIVGNELIQYNPANVDLDACKSKTYTLSVPIGATANDDLSNIGCFDLVLEPTPMSNDDLDLEISSQLNTPIVDRKEPGLLTEEID